MWLLKSVQNKGNPVGLSKVLVTVFPDLVLPAWFQQRGSNVDKATTCYSGPARSLQKVQQLDQKVCPQPWLFHSVVNRVQISVYQPRDFMWLRDPRTSLIKESYPGILSTTMAMNVAGINPWILHSQRKKTTSELEAKWTVQHTGAPLNMTLLFSALPLFCISMSTVMQI